MELFDAKAGTEIPSSGTPPTGATQPSWSLDGKSLAYAVNIDNWGGELKKADIGIVPIDGTTFGVPQILLTASTLSSMRGDANISALSYPSWTPDSSYLAFAAGQGARSQNDDAGLFMMKPDGSAVVRLDNANGDEPRNHQPRFSPFDEGGYLGLSFFSRRQYGNSAVGTKDKDAEGLQQSGSPRFAKMLPTVKIQVPFLIGCPVRVHLRAISPQNGRRAPAGRMARHVRSAQSVAAVIASRQPAEVIPYANRRRPKPVVNTTNHVPKLVIAVRAKV